MSDSRLQEMEERLAHQEKVIEELSDQLAKNWKETEQLRKGLTALTNRFLALEEVATPAPEITKPPHY